MFVLIIDDDAGLQHYLSTLFRKEYPHVELTQAYDGKQAIDVIEKHDNYPNLIFVDLEMPVMSGIEFLESRQLQLSSHNTKVVIITAHELDKAKEASQKFKFIEDYIQKSSLKNSLQKYIDQA